jgi:hypothetical protein
MSKNDTTLVAQIYKAWEAGQSNRKHLGASQIGKKCDRAIWYGFRWFKTPSYSGRIMRLFDRGKREEAIVWGDLMACGFEVECELTEKDGKQVGFTDIGGHFAGSLDAIITKGKLRALVECKTASDDMWNDVEKKGVEESKPEHYYQMQVYMGECGLATGLYISVNKDNDKIYAEWLKFDKDAYNGLRQLAKEIIFSMEPPARYVENPANYICKRCDFHSVCHGGESPEQNCRTCSMAEPQEDGGWKCMLRDSVIDDETMAVGCGDWAAIGATWSGKGKVAF